MEVADIIESVDILEYISQFCELEERSDGEFWALSPLKEENTPSFSVNQELQRYYDFSSGSGGNVLSFIIKYYHCTVAEAVNILKEYAGIDEDVPEATVKRLEGTSIAKRFSTKTKNKKESKAIILPDDYMDRFENNIAKLSVWEDEGISFESMDKFQVRYDPFSDRIVYPIRNLQGDIINVGGRTLDPKWKEKKLRKYTYFGPLGILDTLYGFAENKDEILKKKEIIIFEGAKSVMKADTWGIGQCVSILTSHLNPYQLKILIRLGCRVVFALDSDIDIRKDPNIAKLKPYAPIEWICNRRNLLDPKDSPVDKGIEVFQTLYEERGRLR